MICCVWEYVLVVYLMVCVDFKWFFFGIMEVGVVVY